MDWLNYHHLYYFWTVGREGGVLPASRVLNLAHPTISTQVKQLETALGTPLFERRGRRLVLTDTGRTVYRYAEEIFTLGRELVDHVKGAAEGGLRLHVGVTEALPKLVVRQLLEPAFGLEGRVRVVCREDRFETLLGDLASHALHVVLADAPVPPGHGVRAYHHLLGETDVTFFAAAPVAARLRDGFPGSLGGAQMLVPTSASALRRSVDHWLDEVGVRPDIVAEFDDTALLKVFGGDGFGVFPAPSVIADDVVARYGVVPVGRAPGVVERFYAITPERRFPNPAVEAICASARERLFRGSAPVGADEGEPPLDTA